MKQINKGMIVVAVLIMSIVFSSCGPGQMFGPTITPSPTITFTPTLTPTITPPPTATLTPTLEYVPIELKGRAYLTGTDIPVSDFTVVLGHPEEFRATTDADGNYSIKDIKPGKYVLSIQWELDKSGMTGPCEHVVTTLQSLGLPFSGGDDALIVMDTTEAGRVLLGVGWELEITSEEPFLQFGLLCT